MKYLKKGYEKSVVLKSGERQSLHFEYDGGYITVRHGVWPVLKVEYSQRGNAICDFKIYTADRVDASQGYGTECLKCILDDFKSDGMEIIRGKLGFDDKPKEFKTYEEYIKCLENYYTKLGFDVDIENKKICKRL